MFFSSIRYKILPPVIKTLVALSLLKLYAQQQWDPGMLSLICNDIEDETAVAVQRDLNSLERHITIIQLRKTHYQTSIKSFPTPSRNPDSHLVALGEWAALGQWWQQWRTRQH